MLSTLERHWRTCRRLGGPRDRVLYLYGRVLRRIRWPLPGRRAAVRVHLRGHACPFYVRLSSTDWLVLEEIFERREYAFVEDHIRDPRWIVDLGANVGYSLRYWGGLYPQARLIAVEPHPTNCLGCRQNIQMGGIRERVTLIQGGIAARHGQAELVDSGGEWAYQTREAGPGVEPSVEMFSLAEILDRYAPEEPVDLLKCDIEGAERHLFRDCRPWIKRVRAIAVEVHPPYNLPELLNDLARASAPFVITAVSDKQNCPVVLLTRAEN